VAVLIALITDLASPFVEYLEPEQEAQLSLW